MAKLACCNMQQKPIILYIDEKPCYDSWLLW
jgi:hypothetical protein